MKDLLEQMLKQETQYIMPRAVGGSVAPHQFQFQTPYTPPVDPASGAVQAAIIFRPDPEIFMEQTLLSPATTGDFKINQDVEFKFIPNQLPLSLDATVTTPDVVKTSTATGSNGYHFSSSGKKLKTGIKYYSGVWTAPSADLSMKIYNPDSSNFSVSACLGYVNANGVALTVYTTATTVCASKANTTITLDHTALGFTNWQANISNVNSLGLFVGIIFANPPPSVVPSGFQASITLTGFTRNQATSWKIFSIWDLLDSQTVGNARSQFLYASRFSTTGMSVRITNQSVTLNRGGSIYAARFPGDSIPEGTIDGLIGTISSQTHHKLRTVDLAKGANLPWTPEKIQDWMFLEHVERDPYGSDPLNKPYIVVAMDFTGFVPGSIPSFVISGGLSMEYLTTDISNTFLKSPSCVELIELLAMEIGNLETFSENPEHEQHIKELVKRVMTSDNVKKFTRNVISAGVKLAPMVLSMLA